MEQGNGYTSEGGDRTAHARAPARLASGAWAYDLKFLARCTLYTSAPSRARCSFGRDLLGGDRPRRLRTDRVPKKGLKEQTGAHEENPTLDLPCGLVFAAGQRATEVVGPMLEEEAAKLQADFWQARE